LHSLTDPEYLQGSHYRDASRLNARIQLHRRFSANTYGWTRWLFDHYAFAPDSRILEVGCGPGDLWRDNADRIAAGWAITLSDFTGGMVRKARENLRAAPQRFGFAALDAQAIPFPGDTFDAVFANMMLYHVPDRARALAEIRRVLRRGGRLLVATCVPIRHFEAWPILER
jgi:ubiquinone/menaquinone biosynthesis C-methylase UbiE